LPPIKKEILHKITKISSTCSHATATQIGITVP